MEDDFKNIPGNHVMEVKDVSMFSEFIIFNALVHVSQKIFSTLFDDNNKNRDLVESYIMNNQSKVHKLTINSFDKYLMYEHEIEEEIKSGVFIKAMDIENLIVDVTNGIMNLVLMRMSDDGYLDLYWDHINFDFTWVVKKVDNQPKTETKYIKKRKYNRKPK